MINPASSQLAFVHSLHHSFLCLLRIKFCAAYLCHLYAEQSAESQTLLSEIHSAFAVCPTFWPIRGNTEHPSETQVPDGCFTAGPFCWYKICQIPALEKCMSLCYIISTNVLFIKPTRNPRARFLLHISPPLCYTNYEVSAYALSTVRI